MRIVLFLLVITLVFNACQQSNVPPAKIIPEPVFMEQHKGMFYINGDTKVVPGEKAGKVAELFVERMHRVAGLDLGMADYPTDLKRNIVLFEIDEGLLEEVGPEGYKLLIDKKKVRVEAAEPAGLFYGLQSLYQAMPEEIFSESRQDKVKEWGVPCISITDYPGFSWRGMHLDVSRHFFPAEFIKRYIDLIAMHKMNVFHWHLTDDNGWRIEISKYPKLAEIAAWRVDREDQPWRERDPMRPGEKATYGGYYTQDEIREVVKYAAERHISVIPEIEMPGHTSEVFAAYPEYSCRGEKLEVQPGSYWPNVDIFCAGKDETFQFLEDVLSEVIELFPSGYIHIGGDEADKTRWKECRACQQRIVREGLANEDELQSYFIRRIEKYLNAEGKQLIGWDEILEGGLAPEATVMSWRGFQGGIDAARMGHDVIMCPTSHCYFDYYQADPETEPEAIGGFTPLEKVYSFYPVPDELTEDESKHVLGAQGNVWTEFIPNGEHAEYMAVPRMTALAEVVWTPRHMTDWVSFSDRLVAQKKRFDMMGVNYARSTSE